MWEVPFLVIYYRVFPEHLSYAWYSFSGVGYTIVKGAWSLRQDSKHTDDTLEVVINAMSRHNEDGAIILDVVVQKFLFDI